MYAHVVYISSADLVQVLSSEVLSDTPSFSLAWEMVCKKKQNF